MLCGLFEFQFAVGEGVAIDEVGDESMAVETTPCGVRPGYLSW